MSKKISEMPAKLSMVDADEFTILDSADPAPATKNKRVLKSAALAGKQDLVDNTGQTYLGQSEGWTQAGDSATRNVGALSTDVAAGDAPNNSVAAHNSTYNHANLPTTAEKQGLDNAPTAPSSINPYVTEADVPAGTTLHAELTDLATSGHPGSVISITGGGTGNAVTIAADDSLQDAGFVPDAAGTARPPTTHAAAHMGGADPVTPAGIGAATAAQGATADTAAQPGDDVATFGSGAAADTHVPLADGVGGISWGAQTPGTGTTLHASLTDLATSGHPGGVINIPGGVLDNAVSIDASGNLKDSGVPPGGSGGSTNLSNTPSATEVTVESSSGSDTSIAAATGSLAGVVSAADKAKLDGTDAAGTARPPTAHAASHGTGQGDEVTPAVIGAATAAQGTLADSATQPGDDVATLGSGAAADTNVPIADGIGGVAWGAQTASVGADITLDGYTETPEAVSFAAAYAVPLDGRPRTMTLTGSITALTVTEPTAPPVGGCKFAMVQGAGAYTVAYQASWHWPNGTPTAMPTGAGEILTIMLDNANGWVEARAQVMAQ